MSDTNHRIHQPRKQTPAQAAEEAAIRAKFQAEKPSLHDLVASGDVDHVFSMEDYWELCKAFAGLKELRLQKGLSIADVADRSGLEDDTISRLESGHIDNPTVDTMTRYAKALGKRVVLQLRD